MFTLIALSYCCSFKWSGCYESLWVITWWSHLHLEVLLICILPVPIIGLKLLFKVQWVSLQLRISFMLNNYLNYSSSIHSYIICLTRHFQIHGKSPWWIHRSHLPETLKGYIRLQKIYLVSFGVPLPLIAAHPHIVQNLCTCTKLELCRVISWGSCV